MKFDDIVHFTVGTPEPVRQNPRYATTVPLLRRPAIVKNQERAVAAATRPAASAFRVIIAVRGDSPGLARIRSARSVAGHLIPGTGVHMREISRLLRVLLISPSDPRRPPRSDPPSRPAFTLTRPSILNVLRSRI